jgi:MSHA biogenesis protein MshO
MMVARFKQHGFTLVELIVVIVITGILSTFLVQFILLPIESYSDVARRTRLVDIANTVIEKIRLDVREALPNSVRVGSCGGVDNCVEFLRAPLGGRYRVAGTGAEDELKISTGTGLPLPDKDFDILVPITASDYSAVIRDANKAAVCTNDLPVYVVINNTGELGENAWELDNTAELTDLSTGDPDDATVANRPSVEFKPPGGSGNFTFPSVSPGQRFFLVDTPIKYIWDSSTKRINRYRCYATDTATANATPSVTPAILAAQITNVTFSYQAGTDDLPVGLLTVSVTVKEDGGAESITLLQQIQILNMS